MDNEIRIIDKCDNLLMEHYKTIFKSELSIMIIKKEFNIYENQEKCAKKIVDLFSTNLNIVSFMVLALTQSGKTGLMVCLINKFFYSINPIPTENIFIITGLSDKDWKKQTISRIPQCLRARVFHRNNLLGKNGFISNIKNKKNVLIIIDELQIAAKENQTIHIAFKEVGLMNKKYLLDNDIKIIQLTATPDGTIYDHKLWGIHSETIKLPSGSKYTSCFELYEKNRCFNSKPLYYINKDKTYNKDESLKNTNYYIEKIINIEIEQDKKLYHIVRIDNGDKSENIINNFKEICLECKCILYDQNSKLDLDILMHIEPKITTFIFIKERLRCSKTLENKNFFGSVYERKTMTTNDSCIIQGLLGRSTGYNCNDFSICFTDINTLHRYKELWESNFDSIIKWNSTSTKFKNDKTNSKGTYKNPSVMKGMAFDIEETKDNDSIEFEEFNQTDYGSLEETIEASRKWILNELKINILKTTNIIRGPLKKTTNPKEGDDGWVKCTLAYEKREVHSYDTVIRKKNEAWDKAGKTQYIWKPCYKNLSNKESFTALVFYKVNKKY